MTNFKGVEELQGKEFNLLDLSNKLVDLGYEDIANNPNIDEILESGCIAVYDNLFRNTIMISFVVTLLADTKEESILASYVKIAEVYPF